jgi:hypothetical protein
MVVDDNKLPPKWVEGVGWVPEGYSLTHLTPRYMHLFNHRNTIEELLFPDIPADNELTTSEPDFETPEIEHIPTAELTYEPEDEFSSEFTETQQQLKAICNEIGDKLVEKNRKYGNSALEPKRVFSTADTDEQIKVRLDDKLSRIESGQVDEDEDVLLDIIGYLVLLMVYRRQND